MAVVGRSILTLSALVLAVLGLTTLFAPDELVRSLQPEASPTIAAALQVAGSGLLGFAILDWMSRGTRIGGIYARPLAIGNLVLFTVGTLSIIKAALAERLPAAGLILGAVFLALATAFAWLAFSHDPLKTSGSE